MKRKHIPNSAKAAIIAAYKSGQRITDMAASVGMSHKTLWGAMQPGRKNATLETYTKMMELVRMLATTKTTTWGQRPLLPSSKPPVDMLRADLETIRDLINEMLANHWPEGGAR